MRATDSIEDGIGNMIHHIIGKLENKMSEEESVDLEKRLGAQSWMWLHEKRLLTFGGCI
jgi:hypothetical protein